VDGEISGYLLGVAEAPPKPALRALFKNVWLFFRALTRYCPVPTQRSASFHSLDTGGYGWRAKFPLSHGTYRTFHINLSAGSAEKCPPPGARLISAYLQLPVSLPGGETLAVARSVTLRERRGATKNVFRTLRVQGFECGQRSRNTKAVSLS